jgi:tripartite-type tricarboxylate transporter receptor subunit TctC
MKIERRQSLRLAAGAVALLAVSRVAWAQTYPTRSVTMIVPFAPGGTTDVVARIVAEHLSRRLGQQFVIENVAGAGGTTGTTRTMRASPDGYTIQIGQMGTHAASVALYPDLAYKPDVDFEPIGMVAGLPIVITGKKELPPDNLEEFILYIKTNAEKVNVAHAGVGSITHSTCLLLNSLLGVRPTFVPFTGAAPAMNALLGGQVDYMCNAIPDAVQQVQSGAVKGYAISTVQRSPALPNVPTAKEAGLPRVPGIGLERVVCAQGDAELSPRQTYRCARQSP